MRGWVPMYRQTFEHELLRPTRKNPACKGWAWMDLVQMAQHGSYDYGGQHLQRGEFFAAVRGLAKRWCWSKSAVGRFLNRLETETMIGTVRGTPSGTVYRIVNYDTYAVGGDTDRDALRDTLRDRSGTGAGHKQEGITNNTPQTPLVSGEEMPVELGRHYHRTDSLHKVAPAWALATAAGHSADDLLRAWVARREAQGDHPEYAGSLATWLRGVAEHGLPEPPPLSFEEKKRRREQQLAKERREGYRLERERMGAG